MKLSSLALFVVSMLGSSLVLGMENSCSKWFGEVAVRPCRVQGFEFCTSSYLSDSLRSRVFKSLSEVEDRTGLAEVREGVVQPAIVRLELQQGKAARVWELGSGSGDFVFKWASADRGRTFVLTDLFPQASIWSKQIQDTHLADRVTFESKPVNSSDLSHLEFEAGDVVLTVAMFHHLSPKEAQELLKTIVARHLHLVIVEPLSRTWKDVVMATGVGALGAWYSPEARQDWRVPAVLSFDGVVSALRQYTRPEIQSMVVAAGGSDYRVQESAGLGTFKTFRVLIVSPHLVGIQ